MDFHEIALKSPYRLIGKVQNYSWGGYSFIPDLVDFKQEPNVLYAEYWMGAHGKSPADVLLESGISIPLNTIIKNEPQATLGPYIAEKFGQLPFLFKILDVREMLSIQVHPTKLQAEAGFLRENNSGLPINSPKRNYKDNNHKPELQVALSNFWLLHGFKPVNDLRQTLSEVQEFHNILKEFNSSGYKGMYKYVMEMSPHAIKMILDPLADRVLIKYRKGELLESSPEYWAAKAISGKETNKYDRGIFSIFFFNLLMLKPGQAIYQEAGIPHAALKGQAIELMANSDNVIRGGLTPKYIDVEELLSLITFSEVMPNVFEGTKVPNADEWIFYSPSIDFLLSSISLPEGHSYQKSSFTTEILLVVNGGGVLEAGSKKLQIKRGESTVLFAGKDYYIKAGENGLYAFKASVPRP